MGNKKRIVLKLTGQLFKTRAILNKVIDQIKQLSTTHHLGIVIGGGNFFRGDEHGASLAITPAISHHIGMLATMMNGLILHDILMQEGMIATLFCALSCPQVGQPFSQHALDKALAEEQIVVFSGGIGAPFFTTDTNAVLRTLQMNAVELWKATDVDGIYDTDPKANSHAQLLKHIAYTKAYDKKLAIMDQTAYTLAAKHHIPIRVFNIFAENSLIRVAHDQEFASTIS